jgi:hypothetical protein
MAVLTDATRQLLEADATLMALATGGVWDASEFDQNGLPVDSVTDDRGRMKPTIVLRWRGTTPAEIVGFSERGYMEAYFYDDTGQTVIRQMMARVKLDLHLQRVTATGTGANLFMWVDDFGEYVAEEMSKAAANMSRYLVRTTVIDRK